MTPNLQTTDPFSHKIGGFGPLKVQNSQFGLLIIANSMTELHEIEFLAYLVELFGFFH